jgi:hypothetical protein
MPMRDYSLTVLPPWLLDEYGTAWARATDGVKDALASLLKERVAASMPIRPGAAELAPHAPTGALEALGRDRLMPRAVGEPDAGYAARLADAWEIHADGGTPRGALRALRAAGYPEAMLVVRSQRLYKLDSAGELVVTTLPAGSWCFEPEPQPFWSRYAILFSQPNLPPAWTATTVRTLGARETLSATGQANGELLLSPLRTTNGSTPPPVVSATGGPVAFFIENKTLAVTVIEGGPAYTWNWSVQDGSGKGAYELDMFPSPAQMLEDYGDDPSLSTGLQVTWAPQSYGLYDQWEFDVSRGPTGVFVSTPPVMAVASGATPTFTGSVVVEVVTGENTYTFRYKVAGAAWRTVPMQRGMPVPLLKADNTASGLEVTWPNVSTHYAGASWQWLVTDVPGNVPGEFSPEMNLIRALTKEWNNAAAVFDGIYVVTTGRALGWPLATLGDGTWTLGGSTVLKYQP